MPQDIENLYIFDGFSREVVSFFLLMSQTQNKKAKEIIIDEWDSSNWCAYYINSGKVRVRHGKNEIAILWEGAFFWEMALITDAPRNATVEAMEDTVLQVFLKDDFMTLIQQSTHGQEMKREIRRRIIENGRR